MLMSKAIVSYVNQIVYLVPTIKHVQTVNKGSSYPITHVFHARLIVFLVYLLPTARHVPSAIMSPKEYVLLAPPTVPNA